MMKVLFDGCDFSSRTGPNTFAMRLAMQLFNTGHVIADPDDYDVALAFIEPSWPLEQYRKPVVQRLDGIWFSPNDFVAKNVRIKECYMNCDHVIWQSNFDRNMMLHHWGDPPKGGTVIMNGIKIDPIKDQKKLPSELAQIRNTHEKVFVCSSNWHGQKRLKQNIEMFRHLKSSFYSSSCLIVLGSNPEMHSGTDIFYAGNVSHELCAQTYAIADWMIHLAYLDHCPNVVTECLMQGTPVICSEAGGTREIVGSFGIVLDETVPYNFELIDYENPPKINVEQIDQPLPDMYTLGSHADIDIANVARKYVETFERIIQLG